jgi:hypothetical protein
MRRLGPRLILLAVVAVGLLWWSQARSPRDLRLQIDLTATEPGNATALEVIVSRGGHALARHEVQYGAGGAPATAEFVVHAPSGQAEVETTVAHAGKEATRTVSRVELSPDAPARVRAQ